MTDTNTRTTESRIRKSTSAITLTLLGAAALHGCGDDGARAHDIYASRADCVREWNDEQRCEPTHGGSGGGGAGGRGYYRGPDYTPGGNPPDGLQSAVRPGSKAIASSVSRGGFGSLGSFHSSGG